MVYNRHISSMVVSPKKVGVVGATGAVGMEMVKVGPGSKRARRC